jgi:hypothetical protein
VLSVRLVAASHPQTVLGPLELALELLQPSVRAEAPSVQLGAEQGYPIAIVRGLCLQVLDLPQAHRSNSKTEYVLPPKI